MRLESAYWTALEHRLFWHTEREETLVKRCIGVSTPQKGVQEDTQQGKRKGNSPQRETSKKKGRGRKILNLSASSPLLSRLHKVYSLDRRISEPTLSSVSFASAPRKYVSSARRNSASFWCWGGGECHNNKRNEISLTSKCLEAHKTHTQRERERVTTAEEGADSITFMSSNVGRRRD